ncbi:Uncharacterised protein [Amycolatopsis camponoti]|uniref:Uncharacterized protein n=1 Tax=Amycolatopsis camponoti TaxID=2606593 RepID=A0A6I8LH95_9PSEU|nr:Uncharacterised protein [Amycolatopsis camponoti]
MATEQRRLEQERRRGHRSRGRGLRERRPPPREHGGAHDFPAPRAARRGPQAAGPEADPAKALAPSIRLTVSD